MSKTARRALVSRAIDVQKRVVIREQERIVQEYKDSNRTASRGSVRGASRGGGGGGNSRGASRGGGVDSTMEGVSSGRTSPAHME